MGGDLDHSDFVDPDYQSSRRPANAPLVAAIGQSPATAAARPPSREEINEQVTSAQKALVELKRRQEELERERSQLEEARRRRLEFDQGRTEMLEHLNRGIGLLTENEQSARRDAEQMARTLADLQAALGKVNALDEQSWTAENYAVELTRALTTLENARMEWNSAQMKWPVLSGTPPGPAPAGARSPGPFEAGAKLVEGRTPAEMARLGLALTWPVALAVLAVGIILAAVLARR
ncbi:MAG: hypothetical protein IT581_16970 [Verrucomicrobiales bacterium]|nr:hypothetical protein [Verrucomicrobiales bacterium]